MPCRRACAASARGRRRRSTCSPGILPLFVLLLLPGFADAAPGLHPDSLIGPLAEFFSSETEFVPLGETGYILGPSDPSGAREVQVDAAGVEYARGRLDSRRGTAIYLSMDDHLELNYQRDLEQVWRRQIQKDFNAAAAEQRRSGGRRLEWTVPFPRTPRPLQRFVGQQSAALSINGQLKTTIGGKSQWTAGEVQTAAGRSSKFPALRMDQEQQFTVEGKVGELIDIRITQDTQRMGSGISNQLSDQLANQIKLDYKGDEDKILQEVQAGNTTLSLPGTRFVGFRQQHKGLFGIRAKGHLGPVAFTTIASHEKSKGNRKTFRGGARADTVKRADYDYLRSKYFFLDQFYRDNLPDYRQIAVGMQIRPDDAIDAASLEVYINDFNTRNDADPGTQAREGVAWVGVDGPVSEKTGWVERGTWHRLDPDDDYSLVSGGGWIVLRRTVQERHAMAVSYRTQGGQQFGDTRGDTLKLKLIKARDPRPTFPTWDLEWKNVYSIAGGYGQGRRFDSSTIEVRILKDIPGREPQTSQDGTSYLQVFGLDDHGQDPGSQPDRLIDADYIGLDELEGTLVFPDLTPFNPQHPTLKTLKDTIPEIYTKQQQRDRIEASRYTIEVVSSSAQQRISLGLGVNPASVEVLLNGERLQEGKDFNIGFAGDVTFTRNAATRVGSPGAELEINYESEDLLGLGSQQKTLLGLRSEYEFWGGDGTVGSTLIYNNERTSDRRVRVGAEPARTLVWDLDLRTRFKAPFLTRVVDGLPLLKTAAPSDINLQAEIAQSRPNLNTKGTGFIDDFEGSEGATNLAVMRTRWSPSSGPLDLSFPTESRGPLLWYNPDPVLRTSIWPGQEDQVEAQNNTTHVLVLELDAARDAATSWGGVMTAFAALGDLSQSKFLEVWARGDRGMLYVDLGAISEDYTGGLPSDPTHPTASFVPNGQLDTEDKATGGFTVGDGQVSPDEDVGIDGRKMLEELDYYLGLAGADTTGLSLEQKKEEFANLYPDRNPNDPEGDDWHYDYNRHKDDYSRINGTEGNANQQGTGSSPDSEDLNDDGVLSTRNDYYRYAIDLESDRYVVPGTESKGWRLFRLPLYDDAVEKVGTPDSSRIEYGRLVVAGDPGADEPLKVEIALIEIIGNEWQEDDILALGDAFPVGLEEEINVTTIGTDESTDYRPPPRVRVRRNPQTRTREREQSLVLDYEELGAGHQASVTRVMLRKANYTKYTRLRMYVHGDSLDTYVMEPDSSNIELFVRFGSDTTNYYECVTQVFPGWDGGRPGWRGNEIEIDLLEMAHLKGRLLSAPPDSVGRYPTELDTVIAEPDLRDGEPALYFVRGNPSMQQIRQLTIGLRNRSADEVYSGRVFIDELRLDEARNDAGLAAYVKVNTKLADFMNVDTEVSWQGQDFRTLNTTGRNSTDMASSLNTTTNLHQFLPGRWGLSAPLKAQYSQTVSLPRFGPNSDVELTPAQKDEQRSEKSREFFELQLSKRASKNWLLKWTLDPVRAGASHSRERSQSSVQPLNNSDAQSLNFSYQPPIPKLSVSLLGWLPGFVPERLTKMRFQYLPTNMAYSMNARRLQKASMRRADADTTFQETFTLVENYTSKASPFKGLSGDYSLRIDRDLRKKLAPKELSFGREVRRNQKAGAKFTLRLTKWFDQNYTFQATYEEISDPARRTVQATIDSTTGSTLETRDVTTKNSVSAKYNLKLPTLLKAFGQPSSGKRGDGAEGQKPFLLWRVLRFGSGYIDPLSTTWRRDTSARSFNLTQRPPLAYQLGFEDSLRVPRISAGLTQQDQWSLNKSLDMTSGLKLPFGFKVKPSFNEKHTRRSGSSRTRLRVEKQRTFPRTSISWSRADRVPLLKKLVNSAQVTVNFETTRSEQGEGSLRPGNLLTKGRSDELRISWNGRVRLGPTVKIERRYSTDTDLDFELASLEDTAAVEETTRPLRGSSSREKAATTLRVTYKLKPRGLPFLGNLKSNVDFTFDVGLESETRSSGRGAEKRAPIGDTDKWKTSLKATYRFTDHFRGEGLVRLENSRNNLTDKTRKTREMRVTGILSFR